MQLGRPERAHSLRMRGSDVAHVRAEPVPRVEGIEPAHHAVPQDLRHDRCCGDGGATGVAVDDRRVRRRSRAEPETVDEAGVGGRMQVAEHRAEPCQIGAMKARAIDLGGGEDTNADLRRT